MSTALARAILASDNLQYHPDYIQIDSHKVEEVRKLLAVLSLSSFGNRVVVMDNAEGLTPQSVNNLLKKIEEPSQRTFYLVLTSHEEKILPTLRSRLMAFHLRQSDTLANATAASFLTADNLAARVKFALELDVHEEDLDAFLKTVYQNEMNNFSSKTGQRLTAILKTFEFLEANVKASRVLSYLAVKWD